MNELAYWKLVDEKKIATSVTVLARARSGTRASQFEVRIVAAPGRSAADLLAAYDVAMGELRSRLAQPAEIAGAVYETLIDQDHALENPWTRASYYAKYERLVGTPDYVSHDFQRYEGLTPAAVREALDKWLPRCIRRVVLLGDADTRRLGGERRARRLHAGGDAP